MTDAELEALVALGEALACDCDDTDGWEGGAPTIRDLIAALTALRKQRDELREAARPFADKATLVEEAREAWHPSRGPLGDGYTVAIKLRHCRAARQALSNMEGE